VRFGTLSFTHAPFEDLAARWRWFEALGFDSAWVADELFAQPGLSDFEAWTALGALARETTRMRIGTLVSTLPFRHPTFLAAQALTLDHISGGRAAVGIGSGAGDPEFNDLVGQGRWSASERADRFEELARVLSALLGGRAVDHDGPHYPTVVGAVPPSVAPEPLVPQPATKKTAHNAAMRTPRQAARIARGVIAASPDKILHHSCTTLGLGRGQNKRVDR